MSKRPLKTQFVAQRSYRRRRLRDVARALPIFGTVLWLLPLLYPRGPERLGTGAVLIFVFVVWVGLIVLAWAVSDAAGAEDEAETGPEGR